MGGWGPYSSASLGRAQIQDTQEEVVGDLDAVEAPPAVSIASTREAHAQHCQERCFENLAEDVYRLDLARARNKVVLPVRLVSFFDDFSWRDNQG